MRDRLTTLWNRARGWRPPSWASQLLLVAVIAVTGIVAYNLGARGSADAGAHQHAAEAGEESAQRWTCSMHPSVDQPEPGKCPICAMDLVPVDETQGGGDGDGPQLALSESAVALAGVRTAPVERREVEKRVRLVGFVEHDPTRVRSVPARAGGRLERLFVDYVGMRVRAGDHLAEIDSPELETAQEELLAARRTLERLADSRVDSVLETARDSIAAARERLAELGMTEAQIEQLDAGGSRTSRVTTYVPEAGTVIEQHVHQGDYVDEGDPIITVSDLSRVWVELEAYQSDLPWLRYGQRVRFETDAVPGESFEGRIAFISPTLDPDTRTATVRVSVANPERTLRPGMYVRADARTRIAAAGQVIDPDLAGKWISPMHPEVVKDRPGTCDICGMPLVPAEELGFVAPRDDALPLVIPASAPLITGERAVVYVEEPGAGRPTFHGREVTLGPRAGDWYLVEEGLEPGERVVVQGAFKIDSALQIQARPSMMTSEQGFGAGRREVTAADLSGPGREALAASYDAYLDLVDTLADDNRGTGLFERLAGALDRLGKANGVPEAVRRQADEARGAALQSARADSLEAARQPFETISDAVIAIHERLGHEGEQTYHVAHCPMAYDFEGADWIQRDGEQIWNPYFGSQMLHCGTFERELTGVGHGQ
jgi:Cu(I)/Ag(I) efflux system membrane fusion protein